jgi:hypothetical protein
MAITVKKSVAQLAAENRRKAAAKTPTNAKLLQAPAKPRQEPEPTYAMPMEVKEWIDQATSRMRSLQAKIDRLELENIELKSYKKWAENRILGSSRE